VQIDQGLQASDVAAPEEGELYALMHRPETMNDAMEPIFAVRTATGYRLMCAADGSAAPDVGGIVGGEHLDRDAAGHSDDDLRHVLFCAGGRGPSNCGGGAPIREEEEGGLGAGAGGGGTGRTGAWRGGASRPGSSDQPHGGAWHCGRGTGW